MWPNLYKKKPGNTLFATFKCDTHKNALLTVIYFMTHAIFQAKYLKKI